MFFLRCHHLSTPFVFGDISGGQKSGKFRLARFVLTQETEALICVVVWLEWIFSVSQNYARGTSV